MKKKLTYFTKKRIKGFLELLGIVVVFIIISYYSKRFFSPESIGGKGYVWMIVYFFLVILEIILGFVSAIPLIPLAVNLWGFFITFILTLFGWVVGSAIIFYISRKFGISIVKKFISIEKIYKFEKRIPKGNLFFWIILIRIILPLDIISYIISLVTKVRFWPYIIATTIGFIPWTFLLTFLGTLTLKLQLTISLIGLGIFLFLIIISWLIHKK